MLSGGSSGRVLGGFAPGGKRDVMTGWLAQVPAKLLCSALVGVALVAGLTLLLAWHGMRRLFGVPRVPRPRAMYVALGGFWIALAAGFSAVIVTIALLRDYRRVDGPTTLAEVRCLPVGLDRLELELRPAPLARPERYDVEGDTCVVWVKQVELRPGLGRLGLRALSRVDGVGPIARPSANPDWLTPRPQRARRLVNLVVRSSATVPVAVPLDARARLTIVSSPNGPTLQQSPI
jgi:hypothetical protein